MGAGLSAVALGFGIGFTVAANDAIDEADTHEQKILAAAPPKGTPCDCLNGPDGDAFRQALERRDTMNALAISSYLLSGAAAIFGVAYALWPAPKMAMPKARTGFVAPLVTPQVQGVIMRGEF